MTSIEVVDFEFGGLAHYHKFAKRSVQNLLQAIQQIMGRMSSNKNADIHGRPQWI